MVENGFLYVDLFCTGGTESAEEIYHTDLVSSKLLPVRWHGHQLISVMLLQRTDCPQSLHLLLPQFYQAA